MPYRQHLLRQVLQEPHPDAEAFSSHSSALSSASGEHNPLLLPPVLLLSLLSIVDCRCRLGTIYCTKCRGRILMPRTQGAIAPHPPVHLGCIPVSHVPQCFC